MPGGKAGGSGGVCSSVSIRGQRAVFSSCQAPFQVTPEEAAGKLSIALGKTLGQGFFVSFSEHLINFLCFIYSFPGITRCTSHHKDINTPSRACGGKQPGMEISSGMGAGWRQRQREFHCHGRKYKQISQGHFTVQLNDLFYKDRILTGIFYGVLGDEKHSLLLLLLYYI